MAILPWASRFWSKVDKSGECWEWTGSFTSRGYGKMGICRMTKSAHRLSAEIHFGPIPDGMVVMHTCDNPSCVRPEHLRIGTYKENTRDCVNKGRIAHGTRQGLHTLSDKSVSEIRTRYIRRKNGPLLALEYGVSISTISHIVRNKTWRHVPVQPLISG